MATTTRSSMSVNARRGACSCRVAIEAARAHETRELRVANPDGLRAPSGAGSLLPQNTWTCFKDNYYHSSCNLQVGKRRYSSDPRDRGPCEGSAPPRQPPGWNRVRGCSGCQPCRTEPGAGTDRTSGAEIDDPDGKTASGRDLSTGSAAPVDGLSAVVGPHASPEAGLPFLLDLAEAVRVMHVKLSIQSGSRLRRSTASNRAVCTKVGATSTGVLRAVVGHL